MPYFGFVRVAAASPVLRVADALYNAERILEQLRQAETQNVSLVVFPELCLTGYTCADLFAQPTLLHGAWAALDQLASAGEAIFSGIAVVGLPVALDGQLFNCAAVFHGGRVLGIVPKSFLPNYKEFYEARWFAPASAARSTTLDFHGQTIPFGTDLLFTATDVPHCTFGIEICEDLWVPIPPSCAQALHGATLLLNLSASNEVIGKANYRRQLVSNQSGRCVAAYVYSSCGVSESTTDVVFGGHCLLAENGTMLAESQRFRRDEQLIVTDVDLERLATERLRTNTFASERHASPARFRSVPFALGRPTPGPRLVRSIDAHPFVPAGTDRLRERCEDIFHTQVAGLAKRLEHIRLPIVSIGVSGGLDSTLALLVLCKTLDVLRSPRQRVQALTMPGFGTTPRTLGNARALMEHLGVTSREVDIRAQCLEQMRALGHKPFGIPLDGVNVESLTSQLHRVPTEKRHDLVFENLQARMRTSLLMNAGFVIGTGDVSELALGWCTYNADHMSMYNPNVSIPKTLVRFLVRWAAENEFTDPVRSILLDIVGTPISPELLPTDETGAATQATEASVGPYELNDFFLYYFLRFGMNPLKILYLAHHATFDQTYPPPVIKHWLREFIRRFFNNQFKRSCLPDGPKVGSVSLSPRGDWRMPSDAQATLWLAELAE